MLKQSLAWAAVVLFLAVNLFAQTSRITADVPFEFLVDGKTYPAGSYEILLSANGANQVLLRGAEKAGDPSFIYVLTRISRVEGNDSFIVFDKVGERSYLSEIHVAGMDGFHLKGAPGPHTHVRVKASR